MTLMTWAMRITLSASFVGSFLGFTSQSSANPRGRGWNGAGEASWDSRFDWNYPSSRSIPGWDNPRESVEERNWDPFERLNSRALGFESE